MTLDITQFYQTFFDEADELLADMEQLLLARRTPIPRISARSFARHIRSRAARPRSAFRH
ncbi:MAG: Signal transduction histidine kinase CheA [uncultured Caballeronia sp.]|nr:MAG: Signal transduction histidine kinase CheA [uncultured Caballeronia sp.]